MAISAPASICDLEGVLAEGPVWDTVNQCLWLVDIKRPSIMRFFPQEERLSRWPSPTQVGWVFPLDDGGLLAGLQKGIHRFDPSSGAFELLVEVEPHLPANRLNDATIDPLGRLWFGTMDDEERAPTGRVYCLDRGMLFDAGLEPVAITNGPAFSPDGSTMYHVDTAGGTLYAVPVASDGGLGKPRPFAQINPPSGHPDGPVVDSSGHVWIGLFGGWGVRRYDAEGTLVETVPFPVANVTKIAFGGPDLRTAYATTARKGLDAAALNAQPLAGHLFSFRVDIPGQPMSRYRS